MRTVKASSLRLRWSTRLLPGRGGLLLPFLSALILAAFAGGCGKSRLRSYEGQFCSTNDRDDPYYRCSPAYDLKCINTYSQPITDPSKPEGGEVPIWVCRLHCAPNIPCMNGSDVCCPGKVFGRDYGNQYACVPPVMCDSITVDGGVRREAGAGPDAGAVDASAPPRDAPASADAARAEAGADAGAPDAGAMDAQTGAQDAPQ
jgi:hypothetical protein